MFVFPSWTRPPAPRKFCFCEVLCEKGKCERIQHLQSQKPEPEPIWDSDVPSHYLIFQSERKQKQGQGPCLISSQKTRCKGKRHNYPEGRFFFFKILHWAQSRDQCMISFVISSLTATWSVYDQPRDQCMISHVITPVRSFATLQPFASAVSFAWNVLRHSPQPFIPFLCLMPT